jgi:beta-glucanase (GH16 family)
MDHLQIKFISLFIFFSLGIFAQNIEDDFEGNGTIDNWGAVDCVVNSNYPNPVPQGINTSNKVLEYFDYGGLWGNAVFEVSQNFNIADYPEFSFKIYVPSGSLTGSQPNQVTLKLQNSRVIDPWKSQTQITKPIVLDQWQVVSFNFITDTHVNFDPNSPPPINRRDFDRVLIQVNGENNTDQVVAYIDDFFHAYAPPEPEPDEYDQLIWYDEFDIDGPIDSTKWFQQTLLPLGNSWYSGEIQHYTDRVDNSYVADGKLHIVAKQETYTDQGVTKHYTSARLNSKFAFTYGRVEFRAKIPGGVGTWPAIWMLGQNINEIGAYWQIQGFGEVPWPDCGELDILEHWGANPNHVISAVHNPSTFPPPGFVINSGGQVIPTSMTEFHTYALEWDEEQLEFSIDDVVSYIYAPPVKNAENWPFDAPLYFIMNVAVLPNIAPGFTQSALEVEYIRVYQKSSLGIAEKEVHSNVRAYPIPVEEEIILELGRVINGSVKFNVYNMLGSLVDTQEVHVENGRARLDDLGSLQSGMYLITFVRDGYQELVKFVK